MVAGVAAHLRRCAGTESPSSGCNPGKVADEVVGRRMGVENERGGGTKLGVLKEGRNGVSQERSDAVLLD